MEGKNILLCCDGTGNEYGSVNTSIVRIVELAKNNAGQTIFYDPGVGTLNAFGGAKKTTHGTLFGQAFGVGLLENALDAYKFLMQHYQKQDRVFLFGFSRGAFTVRFLASLVCEWGLLKPGATNLIPYIAKYLKNQANPRLAQGFRQTFCQECIPHFVGVFDTVKSLGMLYGRTFPNTALHPHIKYAYHALSLDEKRKHFQPALWDERACGENQTIEQVWFSGVHSDVGGGYKERGLADISLLWMLKQAEKCGLKLCPHWQALLHPDPLEPIHQSNTLAWKLGALLKPNTPQIRHLPTGAKVHHSVFVKCEKDPTYRAQNLTGSYVVYDEDKTSLHDLSKKVGALKKEFHFGAIVD